MKKIEIFRLVDEYKRKITEMESACFEGSGGEEEKSETGEVLKSNIENLR